MAGGQPVIIPLIVDHQLQLIVCGGDRRYDLKAGHDRRETRAVRTLTVTGLSLGSPPHKVRSARARVAL
ncbi:hypothetical protein [Streptomyces sp. NPDC048623]|uniref:hypothetical protein n=1 Tax=Streptomyces sp. NPDC048623 TaxID=3155761 RepID=UPI0034335189